MLNFDTNMQRWMLEGQEQRVCAKGRELLTSGQDAYYCKEQNKLWCVEHFRTLKFECGFSRRKYHVIGSIAIHTDFHTILKGR